jgi:uncharacterized membrane protein YhiD involved in acid resistance
MTDRIFESLNTLIPTISFFDVFINIGIAFVFGFVIATIYKFTYQGFSYSNDFIITLIIITMVTAVVIMVIGNNLARAFGLVGAMSIIRFRTALKESRDIAFVFFGLAAGMAAGAGNHMIGLVAVPMICSIIVILHWTTYGRVEQNDFLLKFWMVPGDDHEPVYQSVFSVYLSKYNMLNIRSARLGQFLELTFNVQLKKPQQSQAFIKDLSALEGIERASIVASEFTLTNQ